MDAFALNEEKEKEEQQIGFAVLFDENGAPVVRQLDGIEPPNMGTMYGMLWSIVGQMNASKFAEDSNE